MIEKSDSRASAGSNGPSAAGSRQRTSAPLELGVYRALTRMARPAAGLILKLRERRGKEDPARRSERVGVASVPRPHGIVIWVHAASVGETNSILPLVEQLGECRPDTTILLTTGTVTSARLVASRLPPRSVHQFVPLDAPQLVARFLDYWRPSLAVFTEQEIWPNLVVESRLRSIPLALVNGRMSAVSFARWQKRPRLARSLFSAFDIVLAQSEPFAERFRGVGAGAARCVGNLKIDAPPPPVDGATLAKLKSALGGRSCFLAASTHQGEEAIIAAAHRLIAARYPGLCTLIAPRHPERGAALVGQLQREGFSVARRSQGELPDAGTEIYVADTLGELGTLFAATRIAFVGGSLIPHGGQNPIEAVRHHAVVLTGPHRHNFDDSYDALFAHGAALEVNDAPSLASAVAGLLGDQARLDRMREHAVAALAELEGALGRTIAALLPMLPEARAAATA